MLRRKYYPFSITALQLSKRLLVILNGPNRAQRIIKVLSVLLARCMRDHVLLGTAPTLLRLLTSFTFLNRPKQELFDLCEAWVLGYNGSLGLNGRECLHRSLLNHPDLIAWLKQWCCLWLGYLLHERGSLLIGWGVHEVGLHRDVTLSAERCLFYNALSLYYFWW